MYQRANERTKERSARCAPQVFDEKNLGSQQWMFLFSFEIACFRCHDLKCFCNHDDDGIDDESRVIVGEERTRPQISMASSHHELGERDKLNDDEGDEDDATKTIDDKDGDEGGVDGNSRIK